MSKFKKKKKKKIWSNGQAKKILRKYYRYDAGTEKNILGKI